MTERKLPVDLNVGWVTMDCHHTAVFRPSPPEPGDEVYCSRCQAYRRVSSQDRRILVRCQDCKYSRSMGVGGASELTLADAKAAAGRHVLRRATHTVKVTDSDGEVFTVSNDGQGELPLADQIDQRNAGNRDHHDSLRRLFERSSSAVEPRSGQG